MSKQLRKRRKESSLAKSKITQKVDAQFNKYLGEWWNSIGRTTRNWVIFGTGALVMWAVLKFGGTVLSAISV